MHDSHSCMFIASLADELFQQRG